MLAFTMSRGHRRSAASLSASVSNTMRVCAKHALLFGASQGRHCRRTPSVRRKSTRALSHRRYFTFSDVAWTSPWSPHRSDVRISRVAWTRPLNKFCRGVPPWILMAGQCRSMDFIIGPATMMVNARNTLRQKRHLFPPTTVTPDYNGRGAEGAEKLW